MHPTTTTTITAGAAPIDLAAIDRELDETVRRWREIDERSAVLTVLRLALATRNNYPDAAWLTLMWSDQPGTAHLVVGAVYDEDGNEIADGCDDDGNDTAFNLTDSNQHIWQQLLPHDPMRDAYRLVLAAPAALDRPRRHRHRRRRDGGHSEAAAGRDRQLPQPGLQHRAAPVPRWHRDHPLPMVGSRPRRGPHPARMARHRTPQHRRSHPSRRQSHPPLLAGRRTQRIRRMNHHANERRAAAMTTTADFYDGYGRRAVWLGSLHGDADPETVRTVACGRLALAAIDPCTCTYADAVADLLDVWADEGLGHGYNPLDGWPWPWPDSRLTDWAYTFDSGAVRIRPPLRPPPDHRAGPHQDGAATP